MAKILRKSFIAFLVSFCSVVPSPAVAQFTGTTYEEAKKTGKATLVYVHNDVSDFAAIKSNGEVQGLLVDLMDAFEEYVLEKHQISITVKFESKADHSFGEFLDAIKTSSGGVFGLSNSSITQERRDSFKFSQPYIENISILVTENSVPDLPSMSEISSVFGTKTAYSVPASTYLSRLKEIRLTHFPNMNIELVNSGLQVMQKVSSDNATFAIVDLLYYLEFFKKGYPIKRHQVGDQSGDRFGIIMPLNNDWKLILDEFFDSGFIQSAKYRKIISSHLGKSATRLISPQSSFK